MSSRLLRSLVLAIPFVVACGIVPDVKLGADFGIPAISGSTTVSIPQDYKCADPITDPAGKYKVTSSGTAEKCTFVFKQDVTAIKASDYDSKPELQGAQAVNGIDLEVSKFAVRDAATDKEPEGLLDLVGKAFGETILTREDLKQTPPFTKTIEGPAIDALKSQVQAKQDIVIPVDVTVVVSLTPAPPAKLALDFEAQPVLSIGFE